jgi:integrase
MAPGPTAEVRAQRLWPHAGGDRRPATIANIHGVLHKALADAVDAPSPAKAEATVWAVSELRQFLTHVRVDALYAAWLLFATTGMRRGEVAGLVRSDLDWTRDVCVLTGPLAASTANPRGSKPTAPDRSEVGAAPARLAGPVPRGPRVHLAEGRLINPERFTTWFEARRREAELPRIRLHDVRHTYATTGLANATGWHEVKIISQRLGHKSVGFTIDTYAHVRPAADEHVAHTLARLILGKAS